MLVVQRIPSWLDSMAGFDGASGRYRAPRAMSGGKMCGSSSVANVRKCAQRQGGHARAFELAEACSESNALARRDARGDEVACLRRRARGPFTFRGVPKDGLHRGRGLLAAGAGRYSRPARRE